MTDLWIQTAALLMPIVMLGIAALMAYESRRHDAPATERTKGHPVTR